MTSRHRLWVAFARCAPHYDDVLLVLPHVEAVVAPPVQIVQQTGATIVLSSEWRTHATFCPGSKAWRPCNRRGDDLKSSINAVLKSQEPLQPFRRHFALHSGSQDIPYIRDSTPIFHPRMAAASGCICLHFRRPHF